MAVIKASDFPVPPTGLYPVEIEAIKDVVSKFGPALTFTFRILVEVNGIKPGSKLFGLVSPVVTPRSRLSRWLQAMNIKLEVGGAALDPQTLLGKKVIASTILSPDGRYSNVVELHPYNDKLFTSDPVQTPAVMPIVPVPQAAQVVPQVNKISTPIPVPTIDNLGGDEDQLF